jgi:hypothetical protein
LIRRLLVLLLPTFLAFGGGRAFAEGVSLKAYVEYKKATVSISPTKAALDAAEAEGLEEPEVVTYQPNVLPSVGGGIDVFGLAVSHSVSLPQSSADQEARGETTASHSEVHVTRWKWLALDVQRAEYQGFFRRTVPVGEMDLFGDSLFKRDEEYPRAPDMHLTWDTAGAAFGFRPQSFALNEAASSSNHPSHSGWSPLVMITASRMLLESPEPLVPDELAPYFGDDVGVTGGTFYSAGFLPGIGAAVASKSVHLSAVAACGLAWQYQEFTGIDRDRERMRGTACDLRGSVGVSGKTVSAGFLGYKTVQTITAETINVSPASSSAQLFFSLRL